MHAFCEALKQTILIRIYKPAIRRVEITTKRITGRSKPTGPVVYPKNVAIVRVLEQVEITIAIDITSGGTYAKKSGIKSRPLTCINKFEVGGLPPKSCG